MKFLITLIGLLVIATASAQAPAITMSAEYPWRLQVDFSYSSGALVSAPIVQFYRADVSQGATLLAQPACNPPSLTVDLVQNASKTVTVSGVTYTYGQAIGIVTAILTQERAAQLAPTPTPTP